jgi:hypothetical protein
MVPMAWLSEAFTRKGGCVALSRLRKHFRGIFGGWRSGAQGVKRGGVMKTWKLERNVERREKANK